MKITNYHSLNTDVATLLLRLIFGGLFVYYGYMKLVSFDQMLSMFQDIIGIGIKPSLILVIFAEFFCGILVAIGLFTRLAVIPIFITMFVAYFIAHANDGFDVKALAFVFLLLSIVIFILGGGKYSVDRLLSRKD
ncbi:DoxX family protein [Sinomicrobium weinanense]|uniref:DoxX family protein n=1 Tax=Sinomicrobium weinanense TaxID=2842200 RepID=A0A926JQN1_9FLAO|nr:DoxX family protein [Sinomicrobium weinanense]MBC9795539.1 DoxX family protein [Sinomicrobium weinanense]MBU3123314.1 DoxX family protein [Sinomicrobium weinanense]